MSFMNYRNFIFCLNDCEALLIIIFFNKDVGRMPYDGRGPDMKRRRFDDDNPRGLEISYSMRLFTE